MGANATVALIVHVSGSNVGSDNDAGLTPQTRYCSAGIQSGKGIIRRDSQTYTSLSVIDWAASAQRIQCTATPAARLGVSIPDTVVEKIAATCDVVVHFQVGILQGAILTQPEYGVLSFHHGDIRQYRGTPAGLWEFLHDAPQGGVTLQRLTPTLDTGAIVAFESVDLTEADSWAAVRRRLFRVSPAVLARGVRYLQKPSFDPVTVPDEELGTLYSLSDITLPVQAKYLLKELRGVVSL